MESALSVDQFGGEDLEILLLFKKGPVEEGVSRLDCFLFLDFVGREGALALGEVGEAVVLVLVEMVLYRD